MVTVADRVWPAWRRAQDQHGDEWSLELVLSVTGEPRAAVRAVRESILEVQQGAEEKWRPGREPPFPGEWAWLELPEGVLMQVVECDNFDETMVAVTAALGRRGIEGTID